MERETYTQQVVYNIIDKALGLNSKPAGFKNIGWEWWTKEKTGILHVLDESLHVDSAEAKR
jgi:hypothetical protein